MPEKLSNKTLLDLCEFIVDCEHKTALTQEAGYPSIRTPNIGKGRLILENVNRVSEEVYRDWTKRAIPVENDLVLAREAPAGNVAILPKEPKVCLGQRTVLMRPNKNQVEPKYLVYLLLSDFMQHRLLSFSGGATVAHVNMKNIRTLKMPTLPKIDEQRAIGSILSAYDDLIENNTRRIKILEEMAQLIYREWFMEFNASGIKLRKATPEEKKVTGKDMFPEGWEIKRLEEVATITMGQSPESKYYNETGEGLPFHQGVTDFGDRFPKDRVFTTIQNRIADEGDILFSVRAPVGRINIATKRMVLGRGLSGIRSKLEQQEFLFQQLKVRFKEEDTIGGGTIFKSVTKNDMLSIRFVQSIEKYINLFQDQAKPIFKELFLLSKHNTNLRQTRDFLLPKLISGEVEV